MKCAIFFAFLAFTSATPLTGWRNVGTYWPQEFWNLRNVATDDNSHAEAIQQLKQYPHMWTVPEQSIVSQMLMNTHEFPHTNQHLQQLPLFSHETFHHLSEMPIEMHQLPWEQTHETYHHFSGMPIKTHEIPMERAYQQISGMPMNTHGKIHQQFLEMLGIPSAHTPEASHYLSEMPMSHVASLQHYYGNMKNVQQPFWQQDDVAHHQGKPTEYHHINHEVPLQYFHSRLQKFVEEHSEQEVHSLIVHLHDLTQELHHQQEVIGKQLSHVESRLMRHQRHHHQQGHIEEYQQLQQVHHQLQLQKAQLIRQQLAQESVVEYLGEALVRRQQHHFGTQENARPFWRSAWCLGLGGLQREVRVNGERRIFIRNARMMIIFNVPKNNPDYLEIVGIGDGKLIRKVVMDDKQNIITDVRTGHVENYSQEQMNDDQPTTISPPTENHQIKVLLNIFRNYQGFSGEGAFFEILKKVKQAVGNQELHPMIYEALKELEVQPNPQPNIPKRNDTARNVSEKVAKEEVVKSDGSDAINIKKERDAKFKVLEAMRAAQQIEWLQKLLAMQHVNNAQSVMAQQEDPIKQIDSFIVATDKYGDKNQADLRQMLIKTNIQEIQREITRLELIAEQLQNQQDFLGEQKQQMKMHTILGYHQGAQSDQMREMNEAYRQIKEQEKRLVGEQITILKKIHDLQIKLILQNQELDQNLSKEDN
ncbi:unnamed protein product [Ceutorhynchus assimilis]|uniref:Uncharacterized protein n=1 Tax=Ceutorhynchus assimilis TaxID=467358 RepID=A0A9N9MCV1_9CUCU|nr:unnamed protein product [Ceutorhynchus assimilis]